MNGCDEFEKVIYRELNKTVIYLEYGTCHIFENNMNLKHEPIYIIIVVDEWTGFYYGKRILKLSLFAEQHYYVLFL